MNPLITAVICTYNRKNYLRKAVDSLINQTLEKNKYEILIIDNNSNDGTNDLINQNYSNIRNIRYILETRQGVSHSRNTGWQNSRGKYVAYLDDDGVAKENWLENILSLAESYKNRPFAGTGGHVFPIWEIPLPWWLIPEIQQYYSVFNLANKQFTLTKKNERTLPGCNIMYLKSSVEKYGGFNTNLGRKYNNLVSGDETFLNKTLINDGYLLIYEPNIQIKHHVPKSRIRFSWLVRRAFWGGYSNFYMDYLENKFDLKKFLQIFIKSIVNILFNILLIPLSLIFKPRYYFIVYFIRIVSDFGKLYGLINNK